MYAFISSSDGKITATFSNPEMNFFQRRIFTVAQDGTTVHMEAEGSKLDGTYNEKSGTLSLQLVKFLPPFLFTHRTDKDAVGFYPRTPSGGLEWQYRKPLPDSDGWTTARRSKKRGWTSGPSPR
jgi:hypothetical protein